MELYYAGYTVGWPVGLGETLIKTITTAGLKTINKSKMKCVCCWKTVANTNALVNTTNKKLCYSCAYAEAKCKTRKGQKNIKNAATRGTRLKMKRQIPKSTIH